MDTAAEVKTFAVASIAWATEPAATLVVAVAISATCGFVVRLVMRSRKVLVHLANSGIPVARAAAPPHPRAANDRAANKLAACWSDAFSIVMEDWFRRG